MTGNERVMVYFLLAFPLSYGYLYKIYKKLLLSRFYRVFKRNTFYKTISIDVMLLTVKSVNYFCLCYSLYPFIKCFMRLRFTNKDKITPFIQNLLTKWYVSVQIFPQKCLIRR